MEEKATLSGIVIDELHERGLKYVTPDIPGIIRVRTAGGFTYRYSDDGSVTVSDRQRIEKLVIPPAWEEVWICPYYNGHLQVIGKDKKGRKQYLYHPEWITHRSETKYSRLPKFAKNLSSIRSKVEKDLRTKGITKRKVIAAAVKLLDNSFFRIGNKVYARLNKSFGLSTLRDKHVQIKGDRLRFSFIGKKGVLQESEIIDRQLAKIIRKCKEIPGYHLLQYYDESGNKQTLDSGDVNDYIKEICNEEYTAKDFRTLAGTLIAFEHFLKLELELLERQRNPLAYVVKQVAKKLGNTPAVCKKSYIHPLVLNCVSEGTMKRFALASKVKPSKLDQREYIEKILVKFLKFAAIKDGVFNK